MSEDLRIAVVGAGRMGSDHIERIHHRMQRARITAIVDIDEAPDGDIGPVVPPPSRPVTKRGAGKLPQSP